MQHAHVIDGKGLAKQLTDGLKHALALGHLKRPPGLATVLVGDDSASAIYVQNKRKKAEEVGIKSFHFHLDHASSKEDVIGLVKTLNHRDDIDAILVQLPLPRHLPEEEILDAMDPCKDADGIHPENLGHLLRGDPRVIPCTPQGILHMIHSANVSIAGKHAVVVGRSTIVGKPMAHLLLQEDATVTICHSKTRDLEAITRQGDIVIAAVGRPKMITMNHIKPGAFVVDVGINRDENNKICGDVDFLSVHQRAGYLTPVPFGVGPLTIAMLLKNTVANFTRASQ